MKKFLPFFHERIVTEILTSVRVSNIRDIHYFDGVRSEISSDFSRESVEWLDCYALIINLSPGSQKK